MPHQSRSPRDNRASATLSRSESGQHSSRISNARIRALVAKVGGLIERVGAAEEAAAEWAAGFAFGKG